MYKRKIQEEIQKDFEHFINALKIAGKKMDAHYFQLHVAGKEKPVFRERVYCYELYHQLRCVLGDNYPYKLDGEVDKEGHPILRSKLGRRIPDFIVHVPGESDKNLVVIEVKSVESAKRQIKKDVDKIKDFIDKAKYRYGIILIYGNGKQKLPGRIVDKVKELIKGYEDKIFLIWHKGPGEEPKEIQL